MASPGSETPAADSPGTGASDPDSPDGAPVRAFAGPAALESWLAEHHGLQSGVWLKVARKGSGIASVTMAEVDDIVLCYGWITGLRRRYDDSRFLQKITPRRPRSQWSRVNVDRVEALTAAGRMREPGLAAVRAAQEDGRWEAAYASQKKAEVPPDLAEALAGSPRAAAFFDGLGKTDRYRVILRLLRARTAENRARQLARVVEMLDAGQRP
ncbi:YdeI/OmpD-associated family protein [Streptomyces sp. WMMC500]|uniref:YdeI/OmpD-associated family protein n=1 Tax=Streptomyces sp. WMMC500 TaxID=3015154 RepID=UPI00248C82D5|nr:YdeI/OmpD-associated family protein [Streptomyces sp. WMMC500]WBB61477.1 YdeI/OmpD-associated family protein [Streptomyces sp. WMMC500]